MTGSYRLPTHRRGAHWKISQWSLLISKKSKLWTNVAPGLRYIQYIQNSYSTANWIVEVKKYLQYNYKHLCDSKPPFNKSKKITQTPPNRFEMIKKIQILSVVRIIKPEKSNDSRRPAADGRPDRHRSNRPIDKFGKTIPSASGRNKKKEAKRKYGAYTPPPSSSQSWSSKFE